MKISEIFFPSSYKCVLCGEECNGDSRICRSCYGLLPFITGRTCLKCGGHSKDDFCFDCTNSLHSFIKNFSVLDYDGIAKQKLIEFKQGGRKYLGGLFSKLIYEKYLSLNINVDIIIPVPIHTNREKDRGFNQSALLCEDLKIYTDKVREDILYRIIDTPHQTGLSRQNRLHNLAGAFKVVDKKAVASKTILVVDDIYTTGSTLSVIAECLYKAGASAVYGLCLARGKQTYVE